MTYFFQDDFGDLWRVRITETGIRIYFPAPKQNLTDTLHDEWGSWK